MEHTIEKKYAGKIIRICIYILSTPSRYVYRYINIVIYLVFTKVRQHKKIG